MMSEYRDTLAAWKLFVHLLLGTICFSLVLLVTVGLNQFVRYLTDQGVDPFIINLAIGLEYVTAVIDAFLYIIFLARISWHFIEILWGHDERNH